MWIWTNPNASNRHERLENLGVLPVVISAFLFRFFLLLLLFLDHHCLDCGSGTSGRGLCSVWADTELVHIMVFVVMVIPPMPMTAGMFAIVVCILVFAMVVVLPMPMMVGQLMPLMRRGSPASNLMALLLQMMELNEHEDDTKEHGAQNRQTESCRRAFRDTPLLQQLGPFFLRPAEVHERCGAPKAW